MTLEERFGELCRRAGDSNAARLARDIFGFTHPEIWPHWPLLPVICLDKDNPRLPQDAPAELRDCGVLVPRHPVVFCKNLAMFAAGPLGPQLEGVTRITYPSFEALAQEWRGD